MDKKAIFNRNLLALGTGNKQLSSRCAYCRSRRVFHLIESKTGKKVPAVEKEGRIMPLHSRFDPEKEGSRFPDLYKSRGFLLFFGFGGAYHISPFLKDDKVEKILIIEKDLDFFTFVLSSLDLTELLFDKRVVLLVEEEKETIRNSILTHYLPILTGDIQSILLRPAVQLDEGYYNDIAELIRDTLEQVSDDLTVQTRFGKKWFRNTVANLQKAEKAVFKIGSIGKAMITAAGPSLDENIDKIRSMRKEIFLIATDTSLPALLHRNLKPDIVISIDCQDISYNHFMQGYPADVPLLLDLASPVRLNRFTDNRLYFSSGHPFSRYVNRYFRNFPQIDTSGGNVTYAALSLAVSLGAREIYVSGADFSYPRGKSYAVETYLYPWFRNLEDRFKSLESSFFSFIMHNNSMIRDDSDGFIRYISKPMIGYRKLFEAAANAIDPIVVPLKGSGCELQIKNRDLSPFPSIRPVLSAGSPFMRSDQFLTRYLNDLKKLPLPEWPLWQYREKLTDSELELITTVLPAAAEINRGHSDRIESLKSAILWTISILEREKNQQGKIREP
ncbi:MAG: DUF115 domain-containing protein [Spirochaetales bacterium]|nr:DUF115 domain-containing protein [Spirochaetales bacterium]